MTDLFQNFLVNFFGPVVLLLFVVFVIVFLIRGRKQSGRDLREIPAFERLKRTIGLAVEAGTRLHVSIGRGNLSDIQSAAAFAGLALLERIARAASISDRPPVSTSGDGVLAILSQNTLRSAYKEIGAEAQFDPGAGQISGVTPYSYAAGAMYVVADEGISASLLAGNFGSEVALLADIGERSGCVTMGGSDQLNAQAILYAAAHEPLIGEELYAGAAYLGAGGAHLASLKAQDVVRWVLIIIMIALALLRLFNIL
ncbi:MAG: DUF6754 domain-containing protein [Chloroflexota bacterium]